MDEVSVALRSVLRAISRRKDKKIPFQAPFESKIDWFIDIAESSEELPEESGIHLMQDMVNEPAYIVGVDGSSRRFSSPYGGFVLATVAITWGPLPLSDYPPLGYEYPFKIDLQKPFIATFASMNIQSSLVATNSPSGQPYEEYYVVNGIKRRFALADMAHEIRTSLETYGLEIAAKGLAYLSKEDNIRAIILDGPLYQRPWKTEVKRAPILREDWKVLTQQRVEILKKLWDKERIPVVASVKRLEKSRYLTRIHGTLMNYVQSPYPPQDNDVAESYALIDVYVRENKLSGTSPLLIGPFLIRSSYLGVPEELNAPNIVYSYLVLPLMPYNGKLDDVPKCILRLEVMEEVYRDYGMDIFRIILKDLFISKGLFTSQFYADSRCRKSSKILFIHACREAIYMGIELSYETRNMFLLIQGERSGE